MAGENRRSPNAHDLDALKIGETVWDSAVRGLCARRRGRGTYFAAKVRIGRGRRARQRWVTIGRLGSPGELENGKPVTWTWTTARTKARAIIGAASEGRDPAAARDAAKTAPTVAELCDEYLREAPTLLTRRGLPKSSATLATDKGRVERHIKPLLGRHRVDAVTKADIEQFARDVTAGKTAASIKTRKHGRAIVKGGGGTAARTLGLLGAIFAYAIERRLRADNPVRGVKRRPDRRMQRFLSDEEIRRLGAALDTTEATKEIHASAAAAIRLLLVTGARKSEILTLRWENVDLEHGIIRLPRSKTGPREIFLNKPALAILEDRPRIEGNSYVITGEKEGAHFVGMGRAWSKVRSAAGLNGVRLHDLRHSFASLALARGATLPMIAKLLGHADISMTARYAHLSEHPVRRAGELAASRAAEALSPKPRPPRKARVRREKARK